METLTPTLVDANVRELRSRLDSAVRWAARLSIILLCSVVVTGFLAVAYVLKSNETMVEVQLVYLDTDGREVWSGAPGSYELRDIDILARLKDWLRWVRIRPAEPVRNQPLVKALWKRAFDMMTPAGKLTLEEFFREADPLLEANRQTSVEVMITSVVKLSPTWYQLTWTERLVDSRNRLIQEEKWTVRLMIELRPPKTKITQQEASENALGITIGTVVWWPEPAATATAPRAESALGLLGSPHAPGLTRSPTR